MRFVRIIAATVVLLALAGGGEASAHTSNYCGHGTDGIINLTVWKSHISNMAYPYHYNSYNHYQYPAAAPLHSAMTACPNGV